MEDAAVAQERAERKAAALHHLGPETGTGAMVWARAVQDELARHEEARDLIRQGSSRETWERLYATVFLVVFSIHQVLAFEERVRQITGDADLAKARKRFEAVGPNAEALRDLVAHLDDYAVGQGMRQIGKKTPGIADQNLFAEIYWFSDKEDRPRSTMLTIGGEKLDIGAAASAAVELAEVVERIRSQHVNLAGKEAEAAFRRRFNAPPADV
jgi:hypothetical protein